ncbi:hypothetical protein, partial [Acinetobacter baumannii]|uniref:hypothetical protein n=1 Tax=Acinetobacter baumannii TaxID=470 RepID=UPI001C126B54
MFSSLGKRPVKLQEVAHKKKPEIWTTPRSAACIYPVQTATSRTTSSRESNEDIDDGPPLPAGDRHMSLAFIDFLTYVLFGLK